MRNRAPHPATYACPHCLAPTGQSVCWRWRRTWCASRPSGRKHAPRDRDRAAWGRLRLERQAEAGEAPIQMLLVLLAESAIEDANFRIHHLIFGYAIGESRILALHHATVE